MVMSSSATCLIALALFAGRISPSPEVVESSEVQEDFAAGKKAYEAFRKHQAREERHVRLLFDRQHMRQHKAVLAGLQKARARYERVRSKRALDPARQDVSVMLDDVRQKMRDIDEWRNGSKLFGDYDVLIKTVEADYPAAVQASLKGEKRKLTAVRREFDVRLKKITSWLAEAAREPDEEPEGEKD
jgi:hypothetical protein